MSIKIGDYTSEPFSILNGTLQGSPLSPILSALYILSLLEMAKGWSHSNLSLYINDGAIFAVSVTLWAATEKARTNFENILT